MDSTINNDAELRPTVNRLVKCFCKRDFNFRFQSFDRQLKSDQSFVSPESEAVGVFPLSEKSADTAAVAES